MGQIYLWCLHGTQTLFMTGENTTRHGHTQGGGGWLRGLQTPQTLQNRHLKKHNFVDKTISKVLRAFPLSRNQLLKSANDQYIRILKNNLIKLKKSRRQDTVIESRNM
jgi:hypothetical protein